MTISKNRQRLWIAAAMLSACVSSVAAAHPEDTGVEVGLRVGYGIALGDAAKSSKLSDGVSGQVPIQLDLGYRVIPNLFVGLYAQYGFGIVGDQISQACDLSSQLSCSAHDIRLGIEGHFHFLPRQKLDPWVGLGLGFEWLGVSVDGGGAEASSTFSGFEFVNLQAGLDIAVAEHFYIGPFLTLSLAQFSSVSVDCSSSGSTLCDGFGVNGDIQDKAMHEWLMIGLRGAYAP
jgi:hypothetical protein